jgi:hypothetical protein
MRISFAIICLVFGSQVFAQIDTSKTDNYAPTYSGIAVLSKSDIERLPAINFMELLQGAFPFISNESLIEEDYSFIVNGFVLINPNAINISQIEKISFYPTGTLLTRGSFNRKGTFVIDTRPEKKAISFSTKSGILLPFKDQSSQNTTTSDGSNGFFTLNDLTYQNRWQGSFVSGAVSFLKNNSPEISSIAVTPNTLRNVNANNNWDRIRLSVFGGYQLSSNIKIEGGLFFTRQPHDSAREQDLKVLSTGLQTLQSNSQVDKKVDCKSAHAAVVFDPGKNIRNIASAELSQAKDEVKGFGNTFYSFGQFDTSSKEFKGVFNVYSLTNQFIWQPVISSIFKLKTSLLARYLSTNIKEKNFEEYKSSSGSLSWAGFSQKTNSKLFLLNPSISFTIKDFLTSEVGFTHNDYGPSTFSSNTNNKKLLPNAGVRLNLNSLIKDSAAISIELASNYNESPTLYNRVDRLETDRLQSSISATYTSSKSWLNTMILGAWQNRFALQVNHFAIHSYLQAKISSSIPGYSLNYVDLESLIRSWSFEAKTSLINRENKNWTVYGNVFNIKEEIKESNPQFSNFSLFDNNITSWKASLKASITLNRFFAQLSSLLSFDESYANRSGSFPTDDRYSMNFFLAGYKLPIKSNILKAFEVNAQSRNLIHSKKQFHTKYIGIGVHANF